MTYCTAGIYVAFLRIYFIIYTPHTKFLQVLECYHSYGTGYSHNLSGPSLPRRGMGRTWLLRKVYLHLLSECLPDKMKALSRNRNHPAWQMIDDLPVKCSTCVTLKGQLLAVGGEDSDETNNNIYSYNTGTNSWEVISHMPNPSLMLVSSGKYVVMAQGNSTNTT